MLPAMAAEQASASGAGALSVTPESKAVSVIGRLQQDKGGGYSGIIDSLGWHVRVRFERRDKGANFAILGPDDGELGAAWRKAGEFGDFLSVKLDCPSLPAPVNAIMSLKPNGDGFFLLRWQRRENGRDEQ